MHIRKALKVVEKAQTAWVNYVDYLIYAQALPYKNLVQNLLELADVSVAIKHFGVSDLHAAESFATMIHAQIALQQQLDPRGPAWQAHAPSALPGFAVRPASGRPSGCLHTVWHGFRPQYNDHTRKRRGRQANVRRPSPGIPGSMPSSMFGAGPKASAPSRTRR